MAGTDTAARAMIRQQAGIAIRHILEVKDRDVDRYLPDDVGRRLRKTIMDSVNEFAEVCAHIADAEHDGAIVNTLVFEKIAEIHQALVGGNGAADPGS